LNPFQLPQRIWMILSISFSSMWQSEVCSLTTNRSSYSIFVSGFTLIHAGFTGHKTVNHPNINTITLRDATHLFHLKINNIIKFIPTVVQKWAGKNIFSSGTGILGSIRMDV